MRPFLAALILCWHVGATAVLAFPAGSVTAEPKPIKVVTVFVCLPKDQSRHPSGLQIADLLPQTKVKPIIYRAADYPPAVQAADTRKRKAKR